MVDAAVEQLLDELYGSEPGEFIATRDRIARELRADGRRDDAALVAKRRRPTAAADLVNRIARDHPTELRDFLELGRRLRDTQVASVRDASARDDVRALQRDRRASLDQLVTHAPSHRDEVERAFAAALVDDRVAAQVQQGRLERVPEPASGFDALDSAFGELQPSGSDHSAVTTRPNRPKKHDERLARARDEAAQARAEADDARLHVERLRDQLRTAERRADESARRAERAVATVAKLEASD